MMLVSWVVPPARWVGQCAKSWIEVGHRLTSVESQLFLHATERESLRDDVQALRLEMLGELKALRLDAANLKTMLIGALIPKPDK